MVKTKDNTTLSDESPEIEAQTVFQGLRIGTGWGITADIMNVTLYRRHANKKTGDEYWSVQGYYATPQGALRELVNQGVRDTQLVDLKTICDKIDELHKDIAQYVKERG